METVDLLFGAVPKDKLYWQAELKKAEKMQAYAYELEAVATQELVLIEQSEGPSAAITENQADKT